MIYKKTCKTCGKIFESKRIEAQYCSKKCFYSRVGKHKKPRVKPLVHKCKVCGMICKEDICEDCLTKRIPEFEKLKPICYICGANIPE